MKIAYIAAGAGGMYCGSCIRDNTLASALIKLGHEVALIPTYTPMRTDEASVSMDNVFLGGVNIFLQLKVPFFRKTPRFIDKLFDNPGFLRRISNDAGSTDAGQLGELTLATIQGDHGVLKKEFVRLVEWLKNEYKPDIVQLTNSMFLGMAAGMKRELGVPVLCAMQGEDIFLEALAEPHKSNVLKMLQEKAADVDGFVATSDFYAGFMREYLNVSQDRMHVVRLGINLDGHGKTPRKKRDDSLTIGYFARICPEKGLHHLIDAFRILKNDRTMPQLRLKIAGYMGKKDAPYYEALKAKLQKWGLANDVEHCGELSRDEKISFLSSLDVLSTPTSYREPKGLFLLEAWANGVPVVQPAHGAFPEMIEATGGGLLVEPDSPQALADGLRKMIMNPELRERCGENGRRGVREQFSDQAMAEATVEVFSHYLRQKSESALVENL